LGEEGSTAALGGSGALKTLSGAKSDPLATFLNAAEVFELEATTGSLLAPHDVREITTPVAIRRQPSDRVVASRN
jgi:hypothetical protein